jgi:hypothetical protein
MKAHRTLLRCGSILAAVVLVSGCHQGDALTDPPPPTPAPTSTPTPVPAQLAGTWTGRLGDAGSSFTTTVVQNGSTVTFDWTSSSFGKVRFSGNVSRDFLRGHLTAEHDSTLCPIGQPELTGTATSSHIGLSGTTLCKNFDASRVSLELTR